MRRHLHFISGPGRLAAALLLTVPGFTWALQEEPAAEPKPADLHVVLEIQGLHYDLNTPVQVRVTARNESDKERANPLADPLGSGFSLTTADGRTLKPSRPGAPVPAQRPVRLAAHAYFGQVVDVAALFPALETAGRYTLTYSGGGLTANEVKLNIIPAYDPDHNYTAMLKTSVGDLNIDLLKNSAPLAVRNFVDLARQGFYDGLTFHYVRENDIAISGDPRGDGSGGSGFNLPGEFSNRKHLSGSVGMVRALDPDSASSQFYICLAPQPERDGLFSLFGQVVAGSETLLRLGKVPTTGRKERPFFRPLEPVIIESITIVEGEPAQPAS